MKVFVVGGSGFIGGGCARGFTRAGHEVVTLSQTSAGAGQMRGLGYRALTGVITESGPWLDEVASADVVVYAAHPRAGARLTSAWLDTSRATRDAAMQLILPALLSSGQCKAFLYTSAIAALGDHGSDVVTEATRRSSSAVGDYHAQSEALVLAATARGLPGVVLRPGFTYGPAGTFAEFFIKPARKGFYPYPGNGSNFIPWVHIDDLAHAYVLAAAHPPVGEIIHVVDDAPVRLADFGRMLVKEAGGGRSMGMPKWLVSLLAGAPLVEMLTASYRVRNDKARSLLGWTPHYANVNVGLPQVFDAYAKQHTA
ncbi:MAG: NAD-dependent epimerase/dehydratase family protein [Acidobacteriaceae bacterium]|nr:NAD-dependent epimerase/dehydratase family protein [Acidobacteriaceae bacterium]